MAGAILLLIIATGLPAQGLEIFGQLGYNLNSVALRLDVPEVRGEVDARFVHSYHVGVGVQSVSSTKWSWTSSVLFYSSGGFIEVPTLFERNKLSMQQLRVPLEVQYELFPDFRLHLGGYIGYTLSVEISEDDIVSVQTDKFREIDLGYKASCSYRVSSKLQLGLSFNYGEINIRAPNNSLNAEPANISGTEIRSYENRNTEVNLRYIF